jgi:para-nitrobenzyl esterase
VDVAGRGGAVEKRTKGLFRRAIMQSGSGTGAFTPEQARHVSASAAAEAFAAVPDERFLAG